MFNAIRRGNVGARGSPCETLLEYIKEHINQRNCFVQPYFFETYRYTSGKSLYLSLVRIRYGLSLSVEESEALNTLKTMFLQTKKVVQKPLRYDIYSWTKKGRDVRKCLKEEEQKN